MPLSEFAKEKIRSLHLSKKTTVMPSGALPPPSVTMLTSPTQLRDLSPSFPMTPRTADPLISGFPHSRSPSPTRANKNRSSSPNTKASFTTTGTAHSIKSNHSSGKTPSYSETALTINVLPDHHLGSPPLTSDLFSRHSASSASEEAWLVHSRRLRLARLVLSIYIFACSTAALGCSSAAFHAYRSTLLGSNWHLRLWPVDLDLRPTLAVLGTAAAVSLGSLVYLVVALAPSPRSNTGRQHRLFALVTVLALPLSLVAVLVPLVLQNHINNTPAANYRDSIQSFTCRFYRQSVNFNGEMRDLGIPAPLAVEVGYPNGFKAVCLESEAGVSLMCVVLGLGALATGVLVWGTVVAGRVARERAARRVGKGKGGF